MEGGVRRSISRSEPREALVFKRGETRRGGGMEGWRRKWRQRETGTCVRGRKGRISERAAAEGGPVGLGKESGGGGGEKGRINRASVLLKLLDAY